MIVKMKGFEYDSERKCVILDDDRKDLSFLDYKELEVEKFEVRPTNPYLTTLDGVLYSKDMKKLIGFPSDKKIENFVVPEGVENIYGNAFHNYKRGFKYLESITLSTTISKLGTFGNNYGDYMSFESDVKKIIAPSDEILKKTRVLYDIFVDDYHSHETMSLQDWAKELYRDKPYKYYEFVYASYSEEDIKKAINEIKSNIDSDESNITGDLSEKILEERAIRQAIAEYVTEKDSPEQRLLLQNEENNEFYTNAKFCAMIKEAKEIEKAADLEIQ